MTPIENREICNRILKPGDSITFTTPTCLGEDEDVFAIAFFMQAWKHAYEPDQRGSYTLSFTRSAADPASAFEFSRFYYGERAPVPLNAPRHETPSGSD